MKTTKKILALIISLTILTLNTVTTTATDNNIVIPNYICGDANRDGTITMIDTVIIRRYLMTSDTKNLIADEINILDTNGDKEVTILDCVEIQQYLSGLISSFSAVEKNIFSKEGIVQTESDLVKELSIDNSDDESKQFKKNVLFLLNEIRNEYNLVDFKYHGQLGLAAQNRAEELIVKYSHERPNKTYYNTILKEYDLCDVFYCENIASGYGTPSSVVNAWSKSPGHKAAIIEKKYRYVGIGYAHVSASESVDGQPHSYWSVLFS